MLTETMKEYREIPLTQGKVALVDAEDYEFLNRWSWHILKNKNQTECFWAKRSEKGRTIYMHRAVLSVSDPNIIVDHKNRNGLDNRKSNLRVTDKSGNGCNRNACNKTSKYLGVCKIEVVYNGKYFVREKKPWRAQIRVNGRTINLGRYGTEAEAAIAYNKAAKKIHGEFANLNVIHGADN